MCLIPEAGDQSHVITVSTKKKKKDLVGKKGFSDVRTSKFHLRGSVSLCYRGGGKRTRENMEPEKKKRVLEGEFLPSNNTVSNSEGESQKEGKKKGTMSKKRRWGIMS